MTIVIGQSIQPGQRVARSHIGVQHLARVVQRDGVVMALCGNSLIIPRTKDLTGARCDTCDRIAVAEGSAR